jgi:hypothetical protein
MDLQCLGSTDSSSTALASALQPSCASALESCHPHVQYTRYNMHVLLLCVSSKHSTPLQQCQSYNYSNNSNVLAAEKGTSWKGYSQALTVHC